MEGGCLDGTSPAGLTSPLTASPIPQGDILQPLPQQGDPEDSTKFAVLTLVSVAAIVGVLLASGATYCLRHSSPSRLRKKLRAPAGPACTAAYQVTLLRTLTLSTVCLGSLEEGWGLDVRRACK